jgi:hypothetical protein
MNLKFVSSKEVENIIKSLKPKIPPDTMEYQLNY